MNWNHTHSFKDFDRYFVGFDKLFDRFAAAQLDSAKLLTNYPPYNIKKVDDNRYVIEMAVAGFGKQDIELELADDKLTIRGNISATDDGVKEIYRGIANRGFTRQFSLADNVEIRDAELFNGLLRVWLEAIIPEHKKPKRIEVRDGEPKGDPQFLTEKKV